MLYFSIQNAPREREKYLCCAAGCGLTGFMLGSWPDHSRIGRALEIAFQLFSANFCRILGGHFAWQAQYLVRLEGDT